MNFAMVALYRELIFAIVLLYNETCQMARFHLNVTMVALYATRLSLRHLNFAMVALHRDLKFAIVLFYKET